MLRIALVIHSLDGGGAERNAAEMANWWSQSGTHVTLITLDSDVSDRYPVDAKVARVALDLMSESRSTWQGLRENLRRSKQLREAIQDAAADVVISFTDKMNVLTLFACRKCKFPIIVSEQTNPGTHSIGRLWSWLRRRYYPRAHAVVTLTRTARDFCREFVPAEQVHIVGNCVWSPATRQDAGDPSTRPQRLLAVGRLSPEKGYDLLIEAFARVAPTHPHWQLVIAGDGPQRERLERQIRESALQDRVQLLGWVDDIASIYRESQLLVLASRYEGFPSVLLEAMSHAVPVVSFDCQTGPAEIIRNDVDGLLVAPNDVGGLAKAIASILADDARRLRMAQAAVAVNERFSTERYFEQWNHILSRVLTPPT